MSVGTIIFIVFVGTAAVALYFWGIEYGKTRSPSKTLAPVTVRNAECERARFDFEDARQMLCMTKTKLAVATERANAARLTAALLWAAFAVLLAAALALAALGPVFAVWAKIALAAAIIAFGVADFASGELRAADISQGDQTLCVGEWADAVAAYRRNVLEQCSVEYATEVLAIPAPC